VTVQRLALRLILVAIFLAVVVSLRVCGSTEVQAAAQGRTADLVGTWEGAIDVAGASLEIRMEFFTQPPPYVTGTIDIPAQNATALRVRSVRLEGTNVRFELPLGTADAIFDGTYEGDRISGTFVQGPATGTFWLERTVEAPPEQAAPLPYAEEPVSVANGDVTLGGTMTVPEGDGPFPAVVLITGSGPQNRDEEIFGFKVFQVIADHLTRAGIAVVRYDDRGVGQSTGSLTDATTDDFAGDALAFVAALEAREDIDGDRIGLLGHSEGAVAAAIAAAREPELAFVVMVAGTGVRGDQVLRRQAEDAARSLGADDEAVARIVSAHRRATEAVMTGASRDVLTAAVRDLILAQLGGLPPAQQAAIGDFEAYVEPRVAPVVASMESPWMKFMLAFDPATALADVTCPVLAVFGELDTQVPPSLNRAPVEAALAANAGATIKVYPGANHLFQQARTGLVAEYAALDKTFVDGLLEDVSQWILETTAR
jgi:pimeloyl-ACP methyl ester carboxylesterase